MNWLDQFLLWSREHKAAFVSIAVVSHGAVLVYSVFTLNYFLQSEESSSKTSLSHSGSERLYPLVREGDDKFASGKHSNAWDRYESARGALRSLQTEFPSRAQKYRDAERVVQSRMYLAQAAGYLDEILPNK
jgi:hypothetical protein